MKVDWWNIISVFIGGLITWVVAYIYYKKASKELLVAAQLLSRETNEIKKYTEWFLDVLENLGYIETRKEGDKRIRIKNFSSKINVTSSTSSPDLEVDG